MFRVNDDPINRNKKIRGWLTNYPSISIIVSAVNFEWTVSRAIILLSLDTNINIRSKLRKVFGLMKYKELWRVEVSKPSNFKALPEVISNWDSIIKAFDMRNKIVHGRDGCTKNMATPIVEALLKAAAEIRDYCSSCGGDIHKRLPIRRKGISS